MARKSATGTAKKKGPAVETDEVPMEGETELEDVATETTEEVEVEEEEELEDEGEEEASEEAGEGGEAPAEKKAPRGPSHAAMGKAPPPPKDWRITGVTPEGLTVTLGRYVSKSEADPDYSRLMTDGFYRQLKIMTPGGKVEQEQPKQEQTKAVIKKK